MKHSIFLLNRRSALILLSLMSSMLWSVWLNAQLHPDKVYPIPANYTSVNENGVNLMTGDLNLDIPIATISGRDLSYSIKLFYNSRSASLPVINNSVGGQGWKLMDYAKIIKEGDFYYYLDGQKSYQLKNSKPSEPRLYHTNAPYCLWKFTYNRNKDEWLIRTEAGILYSLGNKSEEATYSIYHLTQIKDDNWGDHLDFKYAQEKIKSISNQLDEALEFDYNVDGKLIAIRNTNKKINRAEILLKYKNKKLSSIESESKLSTGLFSRNVSAIHFRYNSHNRIHEILSPSGAIKNYKYYITGRHPELSGKVIRYSINNGYPTHTLAGEQPQGENKNAMYSDIWYGLGSAYNEDNYFLYNKVRIYPGGFYENDHEKITNPFGHHNYYFLNGSHSKDLKKLPGEYKNIDVTDLALRGVTYLEEQHSDLGLHEHPDHLVNINKNLYTLAISHHSSNAVKIPLLNETRHSVDNIKEQSIWYLYDSIFHLQTSVIKSIQNPTSDNTKKKQYQKINYRHAYKDYSELKNLNLLSVFSQQYTTTAEYVGNIPPTHPDLEWGVMDASLILWNSWTETDTNTDSWSPEESYVLLQKIDPDNFPIDLNEEPDQKNWLSSNKVLERSHYGDILTSTDYTGNVQSTQFDGLHETYPIAVFDNANAMKNEAGFLGFEQYESFDGWNLRDGIENTSFGHTGYRSWNVRSMLEAAEYQPKTNRYLFGAFIKNLSSNPGRIGYLKNSLWKASKEIPANNKEWIYYHVMTAHADSTALPTIECDSCLVDDIRFHPLDASFSSNVYANNKLETDSMDINQEGVYTANRKLNISSGTQISQGQNLVLKAGQQISFEQGVRIDKGATVSISLSNYQENMNQPIATLGSNGEVFRQILNAKAEPIGIVGPNESVKALNLSYQSRDGISMFGNSDPENPSFDKNHPNERLQVLPRKKSLVEEFRGGNSKFQSISGMYIEDDLFKVGPQFCEAIFSDSISAKDYALHVEILPMAGSSINGTMGMSINNSWGQPRFTCGLNNNRIFLYVNEEGSEFQSINIQEPYESLGLLVVVMDNRHLFVYLNGRFLFEHSGSQTFTGNLKFHSNNAKGSAFDNFMYLEDPIIGKSTYDALGNHKQHLIQSEPDELYVKEVLYGDALNLPMAISRGTHITTTIGDRGLAHRSDFATLQLIKNNRGGTLRLTGEVEQAYKHNKSFTVSQTYNNDPTIRADRSGFGGALTVGSGKSVNHIHKSNQSNEFAYDQKALQKTVNFSPFSKSRDVTSSTFSSTSSGIIFASSVKDNASGKVQKQQINYDEQLRLRHHIQANYFEKQDASFHTEIDYDFSGNVIYERDPDSGIKQYAYDKNFRRRVMLDSEGTSAKKPYYRYWKYDSIGRVIEEGLYEGENINYADMGDTQSEYVKRAPGSVTVNAVFNGKLLELKAGEEITFKQGFSIASGKTMRAKIQPGLLLNVLDTLLEDDQWPFESDPKRKMKKKYEYDIDLENKDNPALGRLVSIKMYEEGGSRERCSERYQYDLNGNITKVKKKLNEGGQSILSVFLYRYDQIGQTTRITNDPDSSTYPSNYDVFYTYDRLGRVSSIGTNSDRKAYVFYDYKNGSLIENLGRKESGEYGVSITHTFNEERQLKSIIAKNHSGNKLFEESLFYTVRPNNAGEGYYNGLIAGIEYKSGSSSKFHNYYYDGFGRLSKRITGTGSTDVNNYDYDANGNVLNKMVKHSNYPYNYRAGNNQVSSAQNIQFTYDAIGRITSSKENHNKTTFNYNDYVGQVSKIELLDGRQIEYTYGVHNQRIKKVVKNSDLKYLRYFHGLNDYPLMEIELNGENFNEYKYIYGPTGLIAFTLGNSVDMKIVVKDHLGSTRVLTDKSGEVNARYNFDAFGELIENRQSSYYFRYLYTGQEYDREIGIYNYRARMYNPKLGRFYAPDPMSQQNSAYAYVGNNPIMYTDPTGMFSFSWQKGLMSVIGAAEIGVGLGLEAGGTLLDGSGIGGIVGIGLNVVGSGLIGSGLNTGTDIAISSFSDKKMTWGAFTSDQIIGSVTGSLGAATGQLSTAGTKAVIKLSGKVGKVIGTGVGAGSGLISGGITSGTGQLISNGLQGKKWSDGIGDSIGSGLVSGAISGSFGAYIISKRKFRNVSPKVRPPDEIINKISEYLDGEDFYNIIKMDQDAYKYNLKLLGKREHLSIKDANRATLYKNQYLIKKLKSKGHL